MSDTIRGHRTRRGWTQVQLSHLAHLSQGYLCRLERGQRRAGKPARERLCRAFGIAERTVRWSVPDPVRPLNPPPQEAAHAQGKD